MTRVEQLGGAIIMGTGAVPVTTAGEAGEQS